MKNFFKDNKLFLVLLVLFFALRVVDLGSDITNSDAIRWHRRSEKFLNALKQDKLESTYQHYQPGVTLMWLNSVVRHLDLKYQEAYKDEVLTLEHSGYYPGIHSASKMMMILTVGFLFIVQYLAIGKLFNKQTALFYAFLVTTEPFLIGIDRWFHLTSFETFFAFTSFLMLLLWKDMGRKEFLWGSAVLFALAVYSKLTAAVVSLPLLAIFISIRDKKQSAKAFTAFSIIGLTLFVLLLPALWVEPEMVIGKFYNAVVNAVGSDIRTEQLSPIAATFFYPLVLGFKLSPFTLFLVVAGLFSIKKLWKVKNLRFIIVYFGFYFVALMVADKKIDRYSLALFPPLLLFASYHLHKLKKHAKALFLTLSLAFTLWTINVYHPVYSSFYSPLMRGPQAAIDLGVYENSGEFFAQAAQYLNKKDGRPVIAVPNNIDSFAFHYEGRTTNVAEEGDYIVWSHDIDRIESPAYPGCGVEKRFGTTSFTYVYVYNCLQSETP